MSSGQEESYGLDYSGSGEFQVAASSSSWFTVAIASFICAIGLVGNAVVIVVMLLLREVKRNTTNWYILNLAVADTLFLSTIPFQISNKINRRWIFSDSLCKTVETLTHLNLFSSVMFLAVMSLDRYIAVCWPFSNYLQRLRGKSASVWVSVVVWTSGIFFCIPIMIYSTLSDISRCITDFPYTPEQYAYLAAGFYVNDTTDVDYYVSELDTLRDLQNGDVSCASHLPLSFKAYLITSFVVLHLLPFLIMILCYGLIIRRVSGKRSSDKLASKNDEQRNSKHLNQSKRVTVMCGVLVSSFFLLLLPHHVNNLDMIWGLHFQSGGCATLRTVSSLLLFANSALNPFLYTLLNKNFRQKLGSCIPLNRSAWSRSTFRMNRISQNKQSSGRSSGSFSLRSRNTSKCSHTTTGFLKGRVIIQQSGDFQEERKTSAL